jgi:hypothetical protein
MRALMHEDPDHCDLWSPLRETGDGEARPGGSGSADDASASKPRRFQLATGPGLPSRSARFKLLATGLLNSSSKKPFPHGILKAD